MLYEAVMEAIDIELFKRPVALDHAAIERALDRPDGMPVVISVGP